MIFIETISIIIIIIRDDRANVVLRGNVSKAKSEKGLPGQEPKEDFM